MRVELIVDAGSLVDSQTENYSTVVSFGCHMIFNA
jgi:hypothetical protein